MSKKTTLSPAVLAALGLSACVDGCDPERLPLVGRLFEDDDPGPNVDTGPCLELPMDTPPVGPCLEIALPPPQPPVQPCLSPPRPPPPPVAPCLSPEPRPTIPVQPCLIPPQDDFGRCLNYVTPSVQPTQPVKVSPCLRMVPSPAKQKCLSRAVPPPSGPEGGAIRPPREDVLAALISEGVLPPDILERLDD